MTVSEMHAFHRKEGLDGELGPGSPTCTTLLGTQSKGIRERVCAEGNTLCRPPLAAFKHSNVLHPHNKVECKAAVLSTVV